MATGIACADYDETVVDERFDEVVEYAQYMYDIMSLRYFMPATPILTNVGTNRGLPISCYLNACGDSIIDIYDTYKENAILAKNGGGLGT